MKERKYSMLIPDGEKRANDIRLCVMSKPHSTWILFMDELCNHFGKTHLGSALAAEMSGLLSEAGVISFPSVLPSQQHNMPVILTLENSRFARGFTCKLQRETQEL